MSLGFALLCSTLAALLPPSVHKHVELKIASAGHYQSVHAEHLIGCGDVTAAI